MTTVQCPVCDQLVAWNSESRYRPFCSAHCKDIDLGAWAAGDYVISEPLSPTETRDADPSPETH